MPGRFPDPLKKVSPLADKDGTPSAFFVQQWNLLLGFVKDTLASLTEIIARLVRLEAVEIQTTAPIEGGGNILELDPISHAESGVTAGTYGDATHVAQVTVDEFGHVTDAAEVAISSDAAAYFKGATGGPTSNDLNGDATVGQVFIPSSNLTVEKLWGFADPNAVNDSYVGRIAEITSPTNGTIVSVLASSSAILAQTTNMEAFPFTFSSPVTLTAGTPYLLAISITSGVGTTQTRAGVVGTGATNIWELNAPGSTPWQSFLYNTTTLSATQGSSASNTTKRALFLEGTF